MQVLIMRHGDAVLDAASDAVRPLSDGGRDESRQMACWLNEQNIDIERVLVSPYLRAQQTLDVVKKALPLPEEADCLNELTPGGDAQLVSYYLQTLAREGVGAVLVVSHLPLVGYLVAELCLNETAPMFATSAIACVKVDIESGNGVLHWQVSPAQLTAKP
ncbi:phosphohistidine phosphatase SixA [Pectobacterium peruviense]|uniref:Phosphohistidine phosphatase n=1 Tax=Pectobacterium peruviense TaxID=2066479 RepID=A0ABX4S6E6_9GAMM|nr:phosphohistidine phosphatase SixA [Pectobacterium peruviense]KML66032.1 phosphohistidine phosphatase [Pectobacterium peruviense]PKX86117.1 phosphohistidine phosphatase [Pectobacterium peruviense]